MLAARAIAIAATIGLALAQVPVTVTYYNPVPWQTDADPMVAACGPVEAAPLRTGEYAVALSRDLFSRKLCGQRVLIRLASGDIVWGVVWDTMHWRFVRYVDILMPPGKRWVHGKAKGTLFWWDGGI